MARYSVDEFVEATRQQDRGEGLFELESSRMLEVNLDGRVWMKAGAMVAIKRELSTLNSLRVSRAGMSWRSISICYQNCSNKRFQGFGVLSGYGKIEVFFSKLILSM